jgi:hypothetical protein
LKKAPGLLYEKIRKSKKTLALPSFNELEEFLRNVNPRHAREVLDAHEKWYLQRFMNPKLRLTHPAQIPTSLPKLPDTLRQRNLGQLKLMIDTLNGVRTKLGLPVSAVLDTL